MAAKKDKKNKISIKIKSYEHKLLDLSVKDIIEAAQRTGAVVVGPIPIPTKKEIHTVLRSPHVDKKSREQFEIRTHKRMLEIHNPTATTIESLKNMTLPAGIEINLKVNQGA